MSFDLGEDEQNGVLIAVNTILRGSWTPAGVERWWDRPRYQLGDRTPREALASDPTAVVELALEGMMQGSSGG